LESGRTLVMAWVRAAHFRIRNNAISCVDLLAAISGARVGQKSQNAIADKLRRTRQNIRIRVRTAQSNREARGRFVETIVPL
jgi:hypothetical protein